MNKKTIIMKKRSQINLSRLKMKMMSNKMGNKAKEVTMLKTKNQMKSKKTMIEQIVLFHIS